MARSSAYTSTFADASGPRRQESRSMSDILPARPATTTRTSVAAEPAPKPPCNIHSLALIAEKVQITGTHAVEIGENTVLHPYARIRADCGSVTIGKHCIISEKAVIGLAGGSGGVVIGNGVTIESGAEVEAANIGDGTAIEVGAKIGRSAVLGKHCKISPLNAVQDNEELGDYTIVYGYDERRIDHTTAANLEVREAKQKGQQMHIDLLRRLIPNSAAKWR